MRTLTKLALCPTLFGVADLCLAPASVAREIAAPALLIAAALALVELATRPRRLQQLPAAAHRDLDPRRHFADHVPLVGARRASAAEDYFRQFREAAHCRHMIAEANRNMRA